MEAHHPHHVTHKKKWTEYLLEFFMLFLAVFLGFIAENIREHIVEQKRAKDFAVALIGDIKSDTAYLGKLIRSRTEKNKRLDSLAALLNDPPNPQYDSLGNRLILSIFSRDYFVVTDATWQQLKSSGGLRYIRKSVADSLIHYETDISELIRSGGTEATEIRDLTTTAYNFINGNYNYRRSHHLPDSSTKKILRLKEDAAARNLMLNYALHFLGVSKGFNLRHEHILRQANNLIALIKKEYDLK